MCEEAEELIENIIDLIKAASYLPSIVEQEKAHKQELKDLNAILRSITKSRDYYKREVLIWRRTHKDLLPKISKVGVGGTDG